MNSEISLICAISRAAATQVCIEAACTHHPYMCQQPDCSCQTNHSDHAHISPNGLLKRIGELPPLPAHLRNAETEANSLIDHLTSRAEHLRLASKTYFGNLVAKHSSYTQLRQKILSGAELNQTELTGDAIAKMFEQHKNGVNIGTVPVISPERFVAIGRAALQKIDEVAEDISRIWTGTPEVAEAEHKQPQFRVQIINADFIAKLEPSSTELSLCMSVSSEWKLLGHALVKMSLLHTLSLENCDSGDALCQNIRRCKNLKRLRMVKCRVTNEGVELLAGANQLSELNLDNNEDTLNLEGFTTALTQMKRLTVLQMKLMSVKKLQITDKKIGTRGAEFIAINLPGLVCLDIDKNEVGELGAFAIANGLKQLEWLSINDNNIGNSGVEALCRGLPRLAVLFASDCKLTIKAMTTICDSRKFQNLNVGFSSIGDLGAQTIGRNLQKLTWLNLRKCAITDKGVDPLIANLKQLRNLFIDGNQLGSAGAEKIARGMPRLEKLDIGLNALGDDGAVAIARGLGKLRELLTDKNQMGAEGALQIVSSISTVSVLSIGGNEMGSIAALTVPLRIPKLTKLNMQSNSVIARCQEQIRQLCKNVTKLAL